MYKVIKDCWVTRKAILALLTSLALVMLLKLFLLKHLALYTQ
jgi:hypothetical protein